MSNESGGPQAPDNGRKVRDDFEEKVASVGHRSMDSSSQRTAAQDSGSVRVEGLLVRSEGHLATLVSLAGPEPPVRLRRKRSAPTSGLPARLRREPESLGVHRPTNVLSLAQPESKGTTQ